MTSGGHTMDVDPAPLPAAVRAAYSATFRELGAAFAVDAKALIGELQTAHQWAEAGAVAELADSIGHMIATLNKRLAA